MDKKKGVNCKSLSLKKEKHKTEHQQETKEQSWLIGMLIIMEILIKTLIKTCAHSIVHLCGTFFFLFLTWLNYIFWPHEETERLQRCNWCSPGVVVFWETNDWGRFLYTWKISGGLAIGTIFPTNVARTRIAQVFCT